MIRSFKCKDTERLFAGKAVARWINFRPVAERKLQMVHRASRLDDLRIPPNNRLEALKRDRKGQHSIRINDQWRVCFRFEGGNTFDVEIVDKSSITTERNRSMNEAPVNGMRPIHPGEVLREEFLVPLGLTAHALAMALQVSAPRINDIARERRAVSVDTAMRLARYFGTSAEFWLGLQTDHDMALSRDGLADVLAGIEPRQAATRARQVR